MDPSHHEKVEVPDTLCVHCVGCFWTFWALVLKSYTPPLPVVRFGASSKLTDQRQSWRSIGSSTRNRMMEHPAEQQRGRSDGNGGTVRAARNTIQHSL